ncbi:F-box/LRR-repeat protein 16-like [Limulus polyphemus]|uniref:F-box/LRR-repeat protein 16-like n=1 Tax=Limulus polyphemus TaxID=6850 RepID=A0ABM1T269_LIMPO|nr:F-box/LRR-repeat protein 16-like [Limulus polyphemus]
MKCNYLVNSPSRKGENHLKPTTTQELWEDRKFLNTFFHYFVLSERAILVQVCRVWKEVIYQPKYWRNALPVLSCRELRRCSDPSRRRIYRSWEKRGVDSLGLFELSDPDIVDLIYNWPLGNLRHLAVRWSNISNEGMKTLLTSFRSLRQLELVGCNDVTDDGLWSSLCPRIVSVTVADCVHVADHSVAAVLRLLPSLYEFNLQSYHVTDSALAFFGHQRPPTLTVLRLHSCWKLTDQGVENLVHSIPTLADLSLSGCCGITDRGVALIATHLRNLRSLDLSWCPKVTDVAVQYLVRGLTFLEELILDRCSGITDTGIGYISTMTNLNALYLRWCPRVHDAGLRQLCRLRNLLILSLAGCQLLTEEGFSSLVQLYHLEELELTNCPGISPELLKYLHDQLPKCLIVD